MSSTRRTFFGMLAALPFAAWAAVTARHPAPIEARDLAADLTTNVDTLYERLQIVARGERFFDWCYVKEETLPFMRRAAFTLDLRLTVERDGWCYLTGPRVTWVRNSDLWERGERCPGCLEADLDAKERIARAQRVCDEWYAEELKAGRAL